MTTQASIKALTDPNNQKTRWTHRKIAYNGFKDCELTIRELSAKVRKPYNAMQKRIDELYQEDLLVDCGEKEENGQANTIFKHNPSPPSDKPKEITKEQYLKAQQIVFEYEALHCHKL